MNSTGSNCGSSTGSVESNPADLQHSLLSNRPPGQQTWPHGGPRRGKRTNQQAAGVSKQGGDIVRATQLHMPGPSASTCDEIETGDEICMESTASSLTAATPLEEAGNGRIVTMTGTIKRGQKKGHAVEVQLQLTEEEMDKLKKSQDSEVDSPHSDGSWGCGLSRGPHVVLATILFFPFALLFSLCASFYIGTMCWYNVFLYLSEERTVWHKIFLSPLLIIFYPFIILTFMLGISIYSAFVQISWSCSRWLKQILDYDKGFFGWLCGKLGISQCSPYQIVILDEEQNPHLIEKSVSQTAV